MKIYTKTGDGGETGVFAGPRVWKDDVRIEAYGTVDELNAALGLAHAAGLPELIRPTLESIQHELFAVGAQLATPDPAKQGTDLIGNEHVEQLEAAIDRFDADLPALTQFILPGGTMAASHLHAARSICRRAERRVVTLARHEDAAQLKQIIRYLNRLSDLLFVLSRAANLSDNQPEINWVKPPR